MTPTAGPTSWTQVVRANLHRTRGYVAAAQEPCISIRDQETRGRVPGRTFQGIKTGPVPGHARGSWILGVILCPGDDLNALLEWAISLDPRDRDRVRFYAPDEATAATALRDWSQRLGPPYVHFIPDWPAFHKRFGRDHAHQTYVDARPTSTP